MRAILRALSIYVERMISALVGGVGLAIASAFAIILAVTLPKEAGIHLALFPIFFVPLLGFFISAFRTKGEGKGFLISYIITLTAIITAQVNIMAGFAAILALTSYSVILYLVGYFLMWLAGLFSKKEARTN